MLLATLLSVSVAADPVAVMVQSRAGMAADELKNATALLDAQVKSLPEGWTSDETGKRLKVAGLGDASSCQSKLPCLLAFAARLNVGTLVALSASKVGTDRAWALAAYEVKSGAQVVREEWIDEAGQDVSAPVRRFTERLEVLLKPPQPPPLVASADPAPPAPPLVEKPTEPASRPLPKVLLISTAVIGVAAVGCAVASAVFNGEANRTTLIGMQPVSPWTVAQAQDLVNTSNVFSITSVALAIAAAGLGLATALTW